MKAFCSILSWATSRRSAPKSFFSKALVRRIAVVQRTDSFGASALSAAGRSPWRSIMPLGSHIGHIRPRIDPRKLLD